MLRRLLGCLGIDDSASMYATEQIAIKFAAKVFQVETRAALVFKSGTVLINRIVLAGND